MMTEGFPVVLLLLLTSAAPIILCFWWLKRKRLLPARWFLVSLAVGILSVPAALLLRGGFQMALRAIPREVFSPETHPRAYLLVLVFVNVALAEEAGRLCVLAPFSLIAKSILARRANAPDAAALPEQAPAAGGRFSAAAGLAVGLGFALVESVSYGGAGFSAALLRVLSAVPLHGSCGARVGAAAANFRTSPLSAAVSFLSAVFIHGLYDLILIRGSPPLLAVIIALAAFVSSARRLSARL